MIQYKGVKKNLKKSLLIYIGKVYDLVDLDKLSDVVRAKSGIYKDILQALS